MRWLCVIGVLAVAVAVWMFADGTWLMTDEEYQERIDARRKAKAAKAAETNGAKR